MASPHTGCEPRNVHVQVDDPDRQSDPEFVGEVNGLVAPSGGSDKALGENGGRHCQAITTFDRLTDRRPGGRVVGILGVEEPDDDSGVEMDQRHSSRSVSSSSARYTAEGSGELLDEVGLTFQHHSTGSPVDTVSCARVDSWVRPVRASHA